MPSVLVISRDFIEATRGSITATDRIDGPGGGFTTRPRAGLLKTTGGGPGVTPQAGRLRILVVDDEPAILRFLRVSLESRGYAVATAPNGRTALDLIRRDTTDLVVLDLNLPDMDGLDVVRQIRKAAGPCRLSSCQAATTKAPRF
jgi:hypothetical protein